MPGSAKTFPERVGSELDEILDAAIEADILLEGQGVRFRLSRVESDAAREAPRRRRLAPQRVLNISGLGASKRMSDIANLKDQYIADAAADRGE
jgi:hypothetical protein